MRQVLRWLLSIAVCGVACLICAAQDCPDRPRSGTAVQNPYSISSQNSVLNAQLTMGHSVDYAGYTHYCYKYLAAGGVVESPTLRVNPGDTLNLNVVDRITSKPDDSMKMNMAPPSEPICGDSGPPTVYSTNVHFHGMNVPPVCHQDDVIHTLIQPNSPGFQYSIQIPKTQPPGLYWYHPHVHGFAEFQVNGGAAGALIVNGIEKVRPEVAGLTERVFVIRQQYLVPWIPGPYILTINYQSPFLAQFPIIDMKPGEKQFWRVANATVQDFLQLQVLINGTPEPLEMIALDGYPLSQTRTQTTILVPPAGRAEFIVQAPPSGGSGIFFTQQYSTGPTGNPDISDNLALIQTTTDADVAASHMPQATPASAEDVKFRSLALQPATIQRKLYFSEEFGGTNGPIQFYITVDGQKQRVFDPNEQPMISTKVGAIEDWTIENRALETHAFHIHQIHFRVLEIHGKPAPNMDLRDTIEVPFWDGKGPYPSVKVRMDFSDPNTAGTFLFHCHILLHEDLGMMHKILVSP